MTEAMRFAEIHAAAVLNPWSAEEMAALLRDPLVFSHGLDAAFLLARSVADEAELLMIATHPKHRRQGLAARLMARFHDTARERGAQKTFLEVAEDNHAARALYGAAGYAQVGRRKGYYPRAGAPAMDALILSHSLG